MSAHLVSMIDTRDFGSETVRIGDLNGDGAPDLLFAQSDFYTRKITCLTAATVLGEVLWQHGSPQFGNGRIYSDLPVQVYDWDNDGRNEALYVQQARYVEVPSPEYPYRERATVYEGQSTLIALDAETAAEKTRLALPAGADDCMLFADLIGRGWRGDLVVKDRYWNMWGISHEGDVLWHYRGSTGHYPAVADVDGDGRDEVFIGYALIDDDGKPLFDDYAGRMPDGMLHADATCIVRKPDGTALLAFGNGGIRCRAVDGSVLWSHALGEAQHVVAGRFSPGATPLQFLVVERGGPRDETGRASLWLYDTDGNDIWRREFEQGSWAAACVEMDWSGKGWPSEALLYGMGAGRPAVIVDGRGEVIETLEMKYPDYRTDEEQLARFHACRADVWGDSREEVVLFGSTGACVYSNASPRQISTLYNNTLYPGM